MNKQETDIERLFIWLQLSEPRRVQQFSYHLASEVSSTTAQPKA